MRWRMREGFISTALGLALTAVLAGPVWAQPVSAQSARLSVISVEGEEAWISKSGRREVKAAAGIPLGQGQTLRTGQSTWLYLQADDDKIIKLDSTTKAVITQASDKKLKITLEEGGLYFDVKNKLPEGQELSFGTAHTSLSVRGTSAAMETSRDEKTGGTVFRLITGNVEYQVGGQTGNLSAGNELRVVPSTLPGEGNLNARSKEPLYTPLPDDEYDPGASRMQEIRREMFERWDEGWKQATGQWDVVIASFDPSDLPSFAAREVVRESWILADEIPFDYYGPSSYPRPGEEDYARFAERLLELQQEGEGSRMYSEPEVELGEERSIYSDDIPAVGDNIGPADDFQGGDEWIDQ